MNEPKPASSLQVHSQQQHAAALMFPGKRKEAAFRLGACVAQLGSPPTPERQSMRSHTVGARERTALAKLSLGI